MMNPQTYAGYNADNSTVSNQRVSHIGPVLIVAVILALWLISRKKEEAVENPLVDLLVLTVGVLAAAHLGQIIFTKMKAPGVAKFFTLSPAPKA